jgi:hypothetical protein
MQGSAPRTPSRCNHVTAANSSDAPDEAHRARFSRGSPRFYRPLSPRFYRPLAELLGEPLLADPHTPPQVLLAGAPMAGGGGEGATVVVADGGDELAAVAGAGDVAAGAVPGSVVVVSLSAAGAGTRT